MINSRQAPHCPVGKATSARARMRSWMSRLSDNTWSSRSVGHRIDNMLPQAIIVTSPSASIGIGP